MRKTLPHLSWFATALLTGEAACATVQPRAQVPPAESTMPAAPAVTRVPFAQAELSAVRPNEEAALYNRVRTLVANQLEVPQAQVTPNARWVDDLKADSLAIVELVVAVEEGFHLEVPDEDTERIHTVGDLVDYIRQRLSTASSSRASTPQEGHRK